MYDTNKCLPATGRNVNFYSTKSQGQKKLNSLPSIFHMTPNVHQLILVGPGPGVVQGHSESKYIFYSFRILRK